MHSKALHFGRAPMLTRGEKKGYKNITSVPGPVSGGGGGGGGGGGCILSQSKHQAIYNNDTGSLSQRFKSWAPPAPDSRPTLSSLTRTLTYPQVRRKVEGGGEKKKTNANTSVVFFPNAERQPEIKKKKTRERTSKSRLHRK